MLITINMGNGTLAFKRHGTTLEILKDGAHSKIEVRQPDDYKRVIKYFPDGAVHVKLQRGHEPGIYYQEFNRENVPGFLSELKEGKEVVFVYPKQ